MAHERYGYDESFLARTEEEVAADEVHGGISLDQFWARLDPQDEPDV